MTTLVVDLGVGNLGNVERALARAGAEVEISAEPDRIAAARVLVLPGVGAFRPPREALRGAREDALRLALAAGAWLLGICVGYQLLFDRGEEFGEVDGLGLVPGRVGRLPANVILPHIGWNRLHGVAAHPLLRSIDDGTHAYFVHSFAPDEVPARWVLASCTHGRAFAAVAGGGRVFGTQFHPEKSGAMGDRLLRNFLELAHGSAAGD
jgi:imidazole glycerol-phosphate synthase subunit HisH